MADAKISIMRTLRHEDSRLEGKVTRDTGGLTKWGISQKTYKTLDIRNLSLEKAIEIYKKDYFCKMNLDKIKSQEIADNIFDFGVNAGVKKSLEIANQTALFVLETDKVYNVINNSVNIFNQIDEKKFVNLFVTFRKNYYINLVEKNKTKYSKYLKGWLNRAESYLIEE